MKYPPKEMAFLLPSLMPASCPGFCPDMWRGRRGPRRTATSAVQHCSPQTGTSCPTQSRLCGGGEQWPGHTLFLPRVGSLGFAPLCTSPLSRTLPSPPRQPPGSQAGAGAPRSRCWGDQKGTRLFSFTRGGRGAPEPARGQSGAVSP